ncbi:MAG: DUF4347 domain-containing protein [Limnoraphis robusta]|uniref:DUF4347 domain-containing protein n=1 Tax=Limnoraphis robusta TaxID=1118279 RepID=UPI00069CE854|nr:DUF4347 domain-containing protein [Limnoraphis robusta]
MSELTLCPQSFLSVSSPAQNASKTLVFIDANVDNSQYLAQGVKPGIEVHILDAHQDGIEQITAYLFTHPHLETIHIVSHGSPGCLYLGNIDILPVVNNGDSQQKTISKYQILIIEQHSLGGLTFHGLLLQ